MLEGLNSAQRQAVQVRSGPLLVLAGAGTGKTRVVTCRIAHLIRHGTRPDRILAVTFTNKAAVEMQQRVRALLGKGSPTKPEISTFHSLCVKILRRHIRHLGYTPQFAIYDRSDQEGIARRVLREAKIATQQLRPADLLSMISNWKSKSILPKAADAAAQTDKEHLAAVCYRRYQRAIKNAGAVDFDDLLLCTEQLFHLHRNVRSAESQRYDHLLIDEYQDTNVSQYRIATALAERHRNLCVVGDDDQSIYAWRGAEVEHILRFKHDWPDAQVIRLEQNYRSTPEILRLANRLIAWNRRRHGKVLKPALTSGMKPQIIQYPNESQEAKSTVEDIQMRIGSNKKLQYRDIAILFRTNEQPRSFETELRSAKVPYVLVGGMSFFDRKEVRDILAYLKLLRAPHDDVALLRIINTPARGIGDTSIEKIRASAVNANQSVWATISERSLPASLSASARSGVLDFVQLIQRHRNLLKKNSLVQVTESLIDQVDYEGAIERSSIDEKERQSRWDSVQEVMNAVAEYQRGSKSPLLSEFLDHVSLDGRDSENDTEQRLKRNAVALMTLHSAKGLEFPHVYLVGLEEGLLPHRRSLADAEIEEERRLCYVGVTRAQQSLTLSMALTRIKWGKPRPSIPSRFLYELSGLERPENEQQATDSTTPSSPRPSRSSKKTTGPKRAKTKRPVKPRTDARRST